MRQSACRSAYLELAGAKLTDIESKVAIIRVKMRNELASGNGCDMEQLRRASQQVEHFLSAARQRLEDLKSVEDDNWETARDSFNSAWEDVAQSIRKAVARFS